jgi:hypothetical protein
MNTIARKLSIFVLIAAAATTTALTIGATTTFAASNTHTHDIQLMGMTHMPVNWTGDYGSGDFGDFNSAQYGGVQPDNHHSSGNMIADSGDDSNSTAGDFGDFNSAQYGGVQPDNHHSSGNMIADSGDNSNSTAGSDNRGSFNSAQYGSSDSHPHHHKDSTPNSSWMWPTHHSTPDEVDIS